MAVLTFDSNPASILAQTNLSKTTDRLAQSYERLTTGLRINRSSDDPAGLMVAEKLRTDSRVFTQAIRNVSDGISLVNTADSAAQELSNILTRLKELATQAYNSSTTSSQRSSLNTEAVALASEYDRIVAETSFNSRKLLDGSLTNLSIQAGYGATGSISFSLGQNIEELEAITSSSTTTVDGTFEAASNYAFLGTDITSTGSADFDGDGDMDVIGVRSSNNSSVILLNNGDGTFLAPTTAAITNLNGHMDLVTGDFNGDGYQDYTSATNLSQFYVVLGNGNGTFKAPVSYTMGALNGVTLMSGDFNEDNKTDLAFGFSNTGTVVISLGNGDGTFNAVTNFSGSLTTSNLNVSDFNGDGYDDVVTSAASGTAVWVRLGNGNGTFNAPVSYQAAGVNNVREIAIADLNGDGYKDLAVANLGEKSVKILLGNGNGTFNAGVTYQFNAGDGTLNMVTVALSDLNGDGYYDLVAGGSDVTPAAYAVVQLGNGNGTFKAPTYYSIGGTGSPGNIIIDDFSEDGFVDIGILANSLGSDKFSLLKADTTTTTETYTAYIDLTTQTNALTSISIIDTAVSALAIEFGSIAAADSRLSTAVSHLTKVRDNLDLARSKITDINVAQEVASVLKDQILQQGGIAVLAQANLNPKLAVSLLEDLDK